MAPDDRDRTFDKALARHLRPDAPREENVPGEADAPHPGAEILAAYHERALLPEQMISWKGHIAGCERCQEILAQLEATDALPVDAGQQERDVLTMPAHIAAPAPMPAEPQTAAAARWSRRLKMLPGANWRWLAPAGALAAGLLLWVSFHENRSPQFELAKNQQPTAPSPSPAVVPQPVAPANKEAASKNVPTSSADTRAVVPRESGALTQNERVLHDEKRSASVQADNAYADKLIAPRGDLSSKKPSAPADRDARRSDVTASIAAEEQELKKQAPASVSSSPPPPEVKDRSVENLDVVANQVKPEALAKAKSVTSPTGRQAPQAPQQEQQAAGAVAGLRESSALRAAYARNSVTVMAPGSTALWRIAPAGIIQRSTDAGATWTLQASGVVVDLLAGSAPSDKVCWIVGRAGTILRTTDGGAHWRKVSSPIDDDLASIFAVDAQQATISAASTNKSYKTPDAGKTWSPLPVQ